ncbi:MAG: DUF1570 domain-containing protein [Thermoguttaceae bacterium]
MTVFAGDSLLEQVEQRTEKYHLQLQQLAERCDRNDLAEEAARTRAQIVPQETRVIRLPVFPLDVQEKKGELSAQSESMTELKKYWPYALYRLRTEYAAELFDYAKTAAKENRGTLAIHLCLTALYANPDHAEIRQLLGFTKIKDQWRTSWETQQLKSGYIDHPELGWILQKNRKKMESGKRLIGKNWVSLLEDSQEHQDIRKGWVIESEHYVIRTNHSLEEGVRISRRLEDLYRAWKLLFYRYLVSEEELAFMVLNRKTPQPLPRHEVVVFRNRDEYIRHFSANEPRIAESVGLYEMGTRCCYFFVTDPNRSSPELQEDVERTQLHEATHQLFSETRPNVFQAGSNANFWILEGIAMYMESLRIEGNCYVLGGPDDLRFQAAVFRKFESDFYVSWKTVLGMNKRGFQSFKELPALYSQTAGMTYFLMHAAEGRFRDPLVVYLYKIYSNQDQPNSLEMLLGISGKELDVKYQEFLREYR